MTIKDHLLYADDGKQVPYLATPNKSKSLINFDYLIIHFTADTNPKQTINWFLNKNAQASAHLLIDRDGRITQFAPFNQRTWHAGKSEWKGITDINSHSIGIELTNAGRVKKVGNVFMCVTDNTPVAALNVVYETHKNETVGAYWQTYSAKQLEVAKKVSDLLVVYYGLKDVLGHDDIAPGRKSDPGPAFPMQDFKPNQKAEIKTTTTDLNLRKGVGTGYAVISVLPKSTEVTVIEKKDGWVKVVISKSKLTGWVSGSYLK